VTLQHLESLEDSVLHVCAWRDAPFKGILHCTLQHTIEMLQASELTVTLAPRDQRYLVEYEIAVRVWESVHACCVMHESLAFLFKDNLLNVIYRSRSQVVTCLIRLKFLLMINQLVRGRGLQTDGSSSSLSKQVFR
jgi:hypothetical protein